MFSTMTYDDDPPAQTRPDLPDLATRIAASQEQARRRRAELGLPPDADDGGYAPQKQPRKHAAKRTKRHGQFLGTVCDEWPTRSRS
jgi:hypothetical protein